MRLFKVYKHTTPEGGVYIGITSRLPKERWAYGYGYKSNKEFFAAIQRFSWNSIKHEILFEDLEIDEAHDIEMELISYYKSIGLCYNKDDGYHPSTTAIIDSWME